LATDRTNSQPSDPGVSQPPRDQSRGYDIVLIEVAKLQADGDYTKRDLGELRTDMRDVRDRMSKIEVRVDHLPSKGFIVLVVTMALTVIGGLLTIAPKLQNLAGTTPVSSAPQNPPSAR
jgi:hypothetical protein